MQTDPATANPENLGGIAGWVTDVIGSVGEVGVGALIALENIVPPIPSEIVLPFAGFSASRGDIDAIWAWIAATVGSLVGAWVLYGIGAAIGRERLHGLAEKRWFVLFGSKDLDRGERFFERHGSSVVLFARFIPLLRSIVSVPAGVDRMPLLGFSVLTAIGSGLWNALFIWIGYALGERYELVADYVGPFSTAVVVGLGLAVVWLAIKNLRERNATTG